MLALLLGVGGLVWSLQLRAPLHADAESLAALPYEVQEWEARDLPLDEVVESMLRADYNLQRAYHHPLGDVVWLYVGYYGTRRGGTPEHTPRQCYTAHGWQLDAGREVVVDPERGMRVQEMVVEQEGARRLVHYWYRSSARTGLLDTFDLRLDHVWTRLATGRADGALVRLSTPMGPAEDVVDARPRLLALAGRLDAALARHWPEERPET
jgi:EpsI family protein